MFKLDEEQYKKLDKWYEQQGIAERYGGAIGGALTYSFTPTSLGIVTKVTNNFNKETIDLTNYDEW